MPTAEFPLPEQEAQFEMRCCTRAGCGLRFPMLRDDPRGLRCPLCRALTKVCAPIFGRQTVPHGAPPAQGIVLDALLDNIRSAWNVGSMLRAADGAGVRQVHLCGMSPAPDHPRVAKTALGAEKSLAWQFHRDGYQAALAWKAQGIRLWALEGGPRAENLFASPRPAGGAPLLLVAGNELTGIDPDILALCERVVSLPMLGSKGSLNVAVAFGIAIYYLRFGTLPG